MSIVARFSPKGLTREKYDETLRQLKQTGVKFPPDGLEYHLCFGSEANLSVNEVWRLASADGGFPRATRAGAERRRG